MTLSVFWSAKHVGHPAYTGINWKKKVTSVAYKMEIPSWTCYCWGLSRSLLSFIDPSLPLHLLLKVQGCDQEPNECTDCKSPKPTNPKKSFSQRKSQQKLSKHIVHCITIMCTCGKLPPMTSFSILYTSVFSINNYLKLGLTASVSHMVNRKVIHTPNKAHGTFLYLRSYVQLHTALYASQVHLSCKLYIAFSSW